MMSRRHRWGEGESRGHGSGDGTPSGVLTSWVCARCGAHRTRDRYSAPGRGPVVRWTYTDEYGDQVSRLGPCPGHGTADEVSP